MAVTGPTRFQLSRQKGFNLQRLSQSWNGRAAVVVTRAGKHGNPFVVSEKPPGTYLGKGRFAVPTATDAVACFREFMRLPTQAELLAEAKRELAGKNVACTCKPGDPCHGDVWIELVNAACQRAD